MGMISAVLFLVVAEMWSAVYLLTQSKQALKRSVWWDIAAAIAAAASICFNEKSSAISTIYM